MIRPASLRFCVFGLFVMGLVTGCSRQKPANSTGPANASQPVGEPVQGDWVIQRIGSDLDTLNPVTLESSDAQMMRLFINESLLHQNTYTLKFDPCLAETYEISPDQLTYTFHLRHGVKWHDGVPFTAEDVKFTFDRIQDPKVDAAALRSYMTTVKSCDVIDPYTIRFVTTERYYKMLEVLGTFFGIVPKHAFDHGNPDFNKNEFGRHPIGTGPYKFVRWDTGAGITLEHNDDYWDTAHPRYPKRIIFQIIQEAYVAAQLFKKGDLDVFDGVSPLIWKFDLENTASMKHAQETVYPYPAYNYLGFNLRNPLFSDVRVRHAIDLLIPRDTILSQIYLNKYANETSGYDPISSPTYNQQVLPTSYDPGAGQKLLADAGWKNDHGDGLLYKDGKPLSFTLLYRAGSPTEQKIVELIKESLANTGIEVKLSRLEFAQWIERVDEWKFEATMGGWALDFNGDPSQIWGSAQADLKKSSNFLGYKNARVDKLIADARLEYDDDKRYVINREIHKDIHDDYPCCFLFNPHYILLVSDRFQGVRTFPFRPCIDATTWWVPGERQKYRN